MSVLVTGVAGFIGSSLARELLIQGHEVVGIDNLNDYYSTELKEERLLSLIEQPSFHFQKINIANKSEIDQIVREAKPEYIYHLAAQAGVRLPLESYGKYIDSNLTGFSNVAVSAAEFGVKQFLYASSSSVYGNSTQIPYRETEMGLEQVSFYGATKYANEILANTISNSSNTRFRGMRFFTVYGPMGRPDMAYFRLIHCALNRKQFHLFGDGTLRRDFTYISDVTTSILLLGAELANRRQGYADVVNVGGGKPNSISELISCINEITGGKIEVIRENPAMGDVKETVADHSLQNTLTGFVPQVKLQQGIEHVYEWAKQPLVRNNLGLWINS